MAFGVTTTGFSQKTLSDIVTETENEYKSAFGDNVNFDPRSLLGQEKGIHDEQISAIWELGTALYNYQDSNQSEGISLDRLYALNGLTRLPATRSTVVVTITGTPLLAVPSNFAVSVSGSPLARFTISAATSIGAGGTVEATFLSDDYGAIAAPATTLTVIETTVTGITSVNNASSASLGSTAETDTEFRIRRNATIVSREGGTDYGISNSILNNVENVTSAVTISNRGDVTDSDGRPPHSFETLVEGGLDQDIWDQIVLVQPSGIQSFGTESGTAVDPQGVSQTIEFSRIVSKALEFDITLTTNSDSAVGAVYPVDGDDQVKTATKAYIDSLAQNNDVIIEQVKSYIISNVAGITAATVLVAIKPASPAGSNIVIAFGEKSSIALVDIGVTS